MSTWRDERRKDQAADAAERRRDEEHRATLRREERRRDREEARQDEVQRRRDKAQRKAARAAKREKNLTPENVYRKGTLALVATSAAAAIPAQVAYFAKKSLALLPVPFALEGAAWVMAAGVAYSDEKRLPGWVRWLLRSFCVAAASFAARINYLHGAHTSETVGWGLAAVTMLGPLFFEVRQWVSTLSASAIGPKQKAEEKARRKHDRKRRRDHRAVTKLARKLVSAAPYGALAFEDAFTSAWEIMYGTRTPGMTPALHGQLHSSRKALAAAFDAANGSPASVRGRLLEVLHPAPVTHSAGIKKPQVVTDLPPASEKPGKSGRKRGWRKPPPHRRTKNDSVPFHPLAKVAAADTARQIPAVNGSH